MFEIAEKVRLSNTVTLFKIKAPAIASRRKAGQFIMLRLNEFGERIPLTIVDSDTEDGTITIIFQAVGKTTGMLAALEKGAGILDVVGPLGNPAHIENFGTAVCIGGGIGIAPVYPISSALKKAGNKVIAIIGARTKELLILEEKMQKISDEMIVTTDDGSYGHHGFVTQILQQLIDKNTQIDIVFAIGPVFMMSAVCDLTRQYALPTIVSLNPIMVDGTGMCGACRVTVAGKNMFACVDGPEFNGHDVDFNELIRRNRGYFKEEKMAMEKLTCHEGPRCHER
ncbi:MAG: ferredoxin-NADP reductase [Nitrospira bacterium HGW-Nitrospira-1]|nr:MAG: ferredoxin-NADP reductase [Nitrospira bacterium HGW-Nitrospira-1]